MGWIKKVSLRNVTIIAFQPEMFIFLSKKYVNPELTPN